MPEQALPCPFCGQPNPSVYQAGGYWKIKCVDGCQITINGSVKKPSVLTAWNRRPSNGAGDLDHLRAAARKLVAYYDQHGAREFNCHFGTREVHGDDFIKFLREFLTEGDPERPPEAGNLATF
jgi:hypothetical protein